MRIVERSLQSLAYDAVQKDRRVPQPALYGCTIPAGTASTPMRWHASMNPMGSIGERAKRAPIVGKMRVSSAGNQGTQREIEPPFKSDSMLVAGARSAFLTVVSYPWRQSPAEAPHRSP